MTTIQTEIQYKASCERIEELLKVVGNDTPAYDKNFVELDLLSDLVADYEEVNYPEKDPVLSDVIKSHFLLSNNEQMALHSRGDLESPREWSAKTFTVMNF